MCHVNTCVCRLRLVDMSEYTHRWWSAQRRCSLRWANSSCQNDYTHHEPAEEGFVKKPTWHSYRKWFISNMLELGFTVTKDLISAPQISLQQTICVGALVGQVVAQQMRSADCRNMLDYSGQKQTYNCKAAFWWSFKEEFILLGHHQHGIKNNPTLGENKCLSQRWLLHRWLCMRLGDSQGEGINHTGICVFSPPRWSHGAGPQGLLSLNSHRQDPHPERRGDAESQSLLRQVPSRHIQEKSAAHVPHPE